MSALGAVCLAAALAGLTACSEDPTGPVPELVADVERLRYVMVEDPAPQVLQEVEKIADDRPVFGSKLLRSSGVPAARRQLAALERVRIDTEVGRQLAGRLRAAYGARLRALEEYEAVLRDGAADQEALLNALHAQSQADRALLAVYDDMEAIDPIDDSPPGPSGEAAAGPRGGPQMPTPRR